MTEGGNGAQDQYTTNRVLRQQPDARTFASSTGEKAADISPKPTIPCGQASIINKSSNNQNKYSYGKDL